MATSGVDFGTRIARWSLSLKSGVLFLFLVLTLLNLARLESWIFCSSFKVVIFLSSRNFCVLYVWH